MSIDTGPDLWAELERAGEAPVVPEDVLLAARVAVRRAARTETLRADVLRVRRSRRRLRVVTLVVGSLAASVVFGVTRFDVGGHSVGTSSAAAAVLERAASVTLGEQDLVAGPGQYLRVRLVEQGWSSFTDTDGQVRIGNDGRAAVRQERRTRTIWIPREEKKPWVFREGTVVLRNNSADPALRLPGEPTRTWRQPSQADPTRRGYLRTYDPRWFATLPREPMALMKTLRAQSGAEGSGTAYDFQEIYSEVLRSGVTPPDVRAALFEGLAQTPGMRVDHDVTTLNGRAGVGIRYGAGTWEMVFDRTTGRYLGERATSPDFPAVAGLDADKTTWLTSVTTEVVDHAPAAR